MSALGLEEPGTINIEVSVAEQQKEDAIQNMQYIIASSTNAPSF